METKIEVVVIERKPNDDLPRYIGNGEYSHLMQVNPNKTYMLLDSEIVGLLASLTEKQLMQVFKVLHKTDLTDIGDFMKANVDPIVMRLLEMLDARKQFGRYIIDYVKDNVTF